MPGVNGTRGGRERAGKDHTSVDLGYRQQTVKCRLFFFLTMAILQVVCEAR